MSKFKVGDEMWIHTKICITGIHEGKSGQIVYATDKEIHIREAILDQIKEDCVVPPKPTPAAPKFKVGDRVVHGVFGIGTIRKIYKWCGYDIHEIALDNGSCWEAVTETLSPAPEPKYYTGKVFAVRSKSSAPYEHPRAKIRNGHVFEIKDGRLAMDYSEYSVVNNSSPFVSFDDFCESHFCNEWAEVKD